MKTYLAITIGPIYATIQQARRTRELWAASYVFSLLMRELLEVLEKEKIGELLAPVVAATNYNGAGIYPDRCFWLLNEKGEKLPAADWQNLIRKAIQRVENIAQKNNARHKFFEPFFRVFAAKLEVNPSEESAVLQLNRLLDAQELQALLPQGDDQLISILSEDNNIWELYHDSSASTSAVFIPYDSTGNHRLPSLVELATSELKKVDEATYEGILTQPANTAIIKRREGKVDPKEEALAQEEALLKLKQTFKDDFKFRHKYVCFVKADGDSVGATLGAIGNHHQEIQDFSKLLAKFAQEAVDKIIAFNGIPVYAGGDDLLFIAPIQNQHGQHIFNLLSDLDQIFPAADLQALGKSVKADFSAQPALSYGLSIAYYKHPMFEALDNLNELLFENAKGFPGKNAVAFRVLKHSGQAFGATLSKGGGAYTQFAALLKACQAQELSFLTSVMHKLASLEAFLEDALQHGQTKAFFKHHFNESAHQQSETNAYIQAVHHLVLALWKEAGEQKQENPIAVVRQQLFAALRFIQFLNQADHD